MFNLYALEEIRTSTGMIGIGVLFRADAVQSNYYIQTGKAILAEDYVEQPWGGLAWQDCEVAILASGPSMSHQLALSVLGWRMRSPETRKVITINTTYQIASWADVLWAGDYPWWHTYIAEVRDLFQGELWTLCSNAAREYDLNLIKSSHSRGLSRVKGTINEGENSGYQAIGLAHQAGSRDIYLLGYDMKGGHWHKPHPNDLNKPNRYREWLEHFTHLAADCKAAGINVTNCTPDSALRAFPMADWKRIIA